MKRYIMSICLLVIMETGQAAASPDFMYWRLESQHRSQDGQQVTAYRLFPPQGAFEKPKVYLQLTPWEWSGSNRKYGVPEFYSLKPSDGSSSFYVEISSGRTAVVELWASLESEDRLHVAQTLFNTYGKSGQAEQMLEPMAEQKVWPSLLFERDPKFYRAQTGEPLKFKSPGGHGDPGQLEVYDNGTLAALLSASGSGIFFNYTPPHDPALSEGGFSARKDLVFVWRDPEGKSVLSFYLPLYRSSYGRTDLGGGLMVLLASMLLTAGLIWWFGKRSPWR